MTSQVATGLRLTSYLLFLILLLVTHCPLCRSDCPHTVSGELYPLTIATLCESTTDFSITRVVQETFLHTITMAECFSAPHYINIYFNDTLYLPKWGWNKVESGINYASRHNGVNDGKPPDVIIGPYYSNLAMELQVMGIPYLVTDFKGFGWIDKNRVNDPIPWKTVLEIPPPVWAQNSAIVDLFLSRGWKSTILIMPERSEDNQECKDLSDRMLENGISLIQFPLDPRGNDAMEKLNDIVRNAQLFRQYEFLVCSPRDERDKLIEKVLQKARDYGLLKNKEITFVFADPTSTLKPFSGPNPMFRLGLFTATCNLLAFRFVMVREDGVPRNESEATASDAARITSYAIDKYLRNLTERSNKFDHDRFMKVLKSVDLPFGETGPLQFDENGRRRKFDLELYNHGGEKMYQKLGTWSSGDGESRGRLNITDSIHEEALHKEGVFPKIVKIVLVEERPFVMRRLMDDGPNSATVDKYEGFTIDLIKELAKELSFNYIVYMSPHNAYGAPQPGRLWDGMVGEVMNGNATLACGAISISSTRETVIDFSLGVLSTGLNIVVKRPQESFTIFQFMKPFSLELWMAIMGASTTVALVFFAMDYCSSETRRFTIKETIWFTVGTLLKRGTDFAPVPVSQRILTIGLTFFVIITVSTYTANMAAFLTTKNFGETVDSFESLAESTTMGVTTVNNSATATFFKRGTKTMHSRLWSKIKDHGLVAGSESGIEEAEKGSTAFIFDYLINEAAENANCKIKTVGAPIMLQEHGIGMMPGAPFKSLINIALLKMKEKGYIAKLRKRWWSDKRKCGTKDSESQRTGKVQFGLVHTAGVFIVSVFGVCVSACLFISKKIYVAILGAWHRHAARKKEASQPGSHANNAMVEEDREKQRLFPGDRGVAV